MTKPFAALELAALATFLTVAATPDARAILIRDDVDVSSYVALANQSAFQSTGFLYSGITSVTQGSVTTYTYDLCSGTLVSPTRFLTAAHCVADLTPGAVSYVGFGGDLPSPALITPNVASIVVNPLYDEALPQDTFQPTDLAVVNLMSPVAGISPSPILYINPNIAIATLVGYGVQGDGSGLNPYYTPRNHLPGGQNKLAAQNEIATTGDYYTALFDDPMTLGGLLEGSTAHGDSGGPLFLNWNLGGGVRQYLIGTAIGVSYDPTVGPDRYGETDFWTRLRLPDNADFLAGIPGLSIFSLAEPPVVLLLIVPLLALAPRRRRRPATTDTHERGAR